MQPMQNCRLDAVYHPAGRRPCPSAAIAAIRAFGSDFDTASHPSKTRRARTTERGWTDARRNHIDYSFCDACR